MGLYLLAMPPFIFLPLLCILITKNYKYYKARCRLYVCFASSVISFDVSDSGRNKVIHQLPLTSDTHNEGESNMNRGSLFVVC